jgi:hypothetical protein
MFMHWVNRRAAFVDKRDLSRLHDFFVRTEDAKDQARIFWSRLS